MVNISGAWRIFKIPLVLLAFAITLKGMDTLIKGQKKIKIRSYEPRGERYTDIKLIHIMLTDILGSLLASIVIETCHLFFENIPRRLTKACHEITLATHGDGQPFLYYRNSCLFVRIQ